MLSGGGHSGDLSCRRNWGQARVLLAAMLAPALSRPEEPLTVVATDCHIQMVSAYMGADCILLCHTLASAGGERTCVVCTLPASNLAWVASGDILEDMRDSDSDPLAKALEDIADLR